MQIATRMRRKIFGHIVPIWRRRSPRPRPRPTPLAPGLVNMPRGRLIVQLFAGNLCTGDAAERFDRPSDWRASIHQSVVFWARRLINMYVGSPPPPPKRPIKALVRAIGHAKQAGRDFWLGFGPLAKRRALNSQSAEVGLKAGEM